MATSRKSTKKVITTHVGSANHDGVGFFAIKVDISSYVLDIVYFSYDEETEVLKPDTVVHTGIVGSNLLDIVDGIESLINTGMFLDIPPVHVGVLIDSDDGSIVTDIHWCQFTDAFKELEKRQGEIFGDEFPVYDCEDDSDETPFIEVSHKPSSKPTLTVGEVISKSRVDVEDIKPVQKRTRKVEPKTVSKPAAKAPSKKSVAKQPVMKAPVKKPVAKKAATKTSTRASRSTSTVDKKPVTKPATKKPTSNTPRTTRKPPAK